MEGDQKHGPDSDHGEEGFHTNRNVYRERSDADTRDTHLREMSLRICAWKLGALGARSFGGDEISRALHGDSRNDRNDDVISSHTTI